jgi:iron complex outermembrane receptor protein
MKVWLGCVFSVFLAVMGGEASQAQSSSSTAASNEAAPTAKELDEIIVTGSRVEGRANDSPTPLTTVTADQLNLAAPQGLSASLNQLPEFRGSSTSTNPGSSSAGSVGLDVLDLRNLGAQRTLTLLDGQRPIPSTSIGTVDISTLPQLLVKRVDVVTGGASAAYGSDAVAGVVNIVLDTDFTGLKGQVQGGISRYGDNGAYGASLAWGGDIFDRLHLVTSVDIYSRNGQGMNDSNRPWQEASPGIINNPISGASPAQFVVPSNVRTTAATTGGLINSGPLQGTTFGPGGTLGQFNYGTDAGPVFGIGGDGPIESISNTASVDRDSVFAHLKYEISDDLSVYAQAQYSKVTTGFQQYSPWIYTSTSATIFSGNPYIPAPLQQIMTAKGITSFPLAEIFSDFPPINTQTDTIVNQYTLGVIGKFDGWSYDAYASGGQSAQRVTAYNSTNFQTLYASLDAVTNPANGQIACATALSGLTPGCVPLNPFGGQSASTSAINYVTGTQFYNLTIRQDDFAFNVRRDLFSLWGADPAKFAFGAEYRRLSANQYTDGGGTQTINLTGIPGAPAALQGREGIYLIADFAPIAGSYDVKEVYTEINLPILKDLPFANLLDVDGAVRNTDYSTSGDVNTWKLGLNYKPIQDVRLRGTFSQDIRAPNITELFTARSFSFLGQVNNPATNAVVAASGFNAGNVNLAPEKAKTETMGVVYTPSWISGFQASVDYFKIRIDGAISSLTPQQTADACNSGSAVACSNIVKTPTEWNFTFPELNLDSLETEGVDIEADYRQPVGKGVISVRGLGTLTNVYNESIPGAAVQHMAGCVGQCNNPKWEGQLQVDYTQGLWGIFVQERYISNGKFNTLFVQGVSIDNNDVPSVYYTDLTIRSRLGTDSKLEAFLTINNVFDKDPPIAPQNQAQFIPASNFTLYDNIGRYFTLGFRFSF